MSIRIAGQGFRDLSRPFYDNTLLAVGRFDVTGIPPGYSRIELTLSNARSDVAANIDNIFMLFNGDTTATNYRYTRHQATSATHATASVDSPEIGIVAGSSTTSTYVANTTINILNYTSADHKMSEGRTVMRRSDGGHETAIEDFAHAWESTAVVNQITLQPDGYAADEFEADTKLQIWLYR